MGKSVYVIPYRYTNDNNQIEYLVARKNLYLPEHNKMKKCLANNGGQYVFIGGVAKRLSNTRDTATIEFFEETGEDYIKRSKLKIIYNSNNYVAYSIHIQDLDTDIINTNILTGNLHSLELQKVLWVESNNLIKYFQVFEIEPRIRQQISTALDNGFDTQEINDRLYDSNDWYINIIRHLLNKNSNKYYNNHI